MIPSVPLADAPRNRGCRPGGRLTVAGLPDRTMPNIIRTSAGITLRVTSTGHLAVIPRGAICHGYQNACVCPECLDRKQRPVTAQPPAPQPWEPRQAA